MDAVENPTTIIIDVPADGQFQICVNRHRYLNSLGVWVGDNPFDFVVPLTMCQLAMFSIISRTLYYALRHLKTPRFICNVVAGILMGPSFLGYKRKFLDVIFQPMQAPLLLTLNRIGVAYFVFLVSLKMDIVTTLRAGKQCWRFGIIPFVLSFLVITSLSNLYMPNGGDQGTNQATKQLPKVFALGSFAVISEYLLELNIITTELGQIALSSAMVGEIMQWIVLILVSATTAPKRGAIAFLGCSCGFLLFCVFVVRPAAKAIIQRTPMGKPVKEIYVVLILLSVSVVSAVGDAIGISFIIAPILFGLAIPNGPPLATTIIEKSEVVISQLVMPFFFLHVGIKTDLPSIKEWKVVMTFQAIVLAGFFVKVLACVAVALSYKISPKHGLVLGLILNTKGLMELIFLSRMLGAMVIDGPTYSYVVLYIVLNTAICTPLIKFLYRHRPRVSKTLSILNEGHVSTIQGTLHTSGFNIISCVHNDGNVHGMIALLEACNPSQESPIFVHVIHLIELLGKSTPVLLPLSTQNEKRLSINYPNTNHIMRAFNNYSTNSNGPVTVFSYVNVAPYNNMHEAVCNLAEDKSVTFLVIPFHETDQIISRHVVTTIRDLNTSFQTHARCTVGILVDKYSKLGMSSSKFCFHVAIFFMGGPDDREALALGIRMLERVNTRVTLLRFVVENNNNNNNNDNNDMLEVGVDETELGKQEGKEEELREEEDEVMLDNSLVDEFKGKRLNHNNAICHEVLVEDKMEIILGVIRDMEKELYDLVMVGKRHCIGNLTDEEMADFMDNADQLGVVGDMLASTEFCDGKVPLLVMQCGEKRVKSLEKQGSGNSYY